MKKKGFTLIELLAVIVVLAIIALIATPIVLNLINNAKEGAAKSSATAYVKAVENGVVQELLNSNDQSYTGKFNVDSTGLKLVSDTDNNKKITVDVSGKLPKENSYVVLDENGTVVSGYFTIDNYNINYSNGTAEIAEKNSSYTELEKNSIEFLKAENAMQKEKYDYYRTELLKFFSESEISKFIIVDAVYGNHSDSPEEGTIYFSIEFKDEINDTITSKFDQFADSINASSRGRSSYLDGKITTFDFAIKYDNYESFEMNFSGKVPTYFQATYKKMPGDNIVNNYNTKWIAIKYSGDNKTYYVNTDGVVSSY